MVVAEATWQNGILEANETGVISWAATDANPITSKSLTVDGRAPRRSAGPYGPPLLLRPLQSAESPASTAYTITMTDSLAHTTTYYTFSRCRFGLAISMVVVGDPHLFANEKGVVTWAVTDANPITSKSLTIDGVAAAVGGPYGPNYYAGTFGPLSAGVHTYTITVTDSLAHTTSYTNTFQVATVPGPAISLVVVAEATWQDGILESNEKGVVTWAVTDANPIRSKSLVIDGVAERSRRPVWTRTTTPARSVRSAWASTRYTITVTDSLGSHRHLQQHVLGGDCPGPAISLVVVAEATWQNGILESNEKGVVIGRLPMRIRSRSNRSPSMECPEAVGGPYGPNYYSGTSVRSSAGVHHYTIMVTDSLAHTASYTNTFSVAALLTVSAAAPPQGVAAR